METKEQKIRRKFKKVIANAPEFLEVDKKKMLDEFCNWFKENHRQITQEELDELISKSKKDGKS